MIAGLYAGLALWAGLEAYQRLSSPETCCHPRRFGFKCRANLAGNRSGNGPRRQQAEGKAVGATIIDGKAIAATIREELAVDVAAFHADSGITPPLAAVLVGDDPASAVYVRNKQRACEKTGIARPCTGSTRHIPGPLLDLVNQLNADPISTGSCVNSHCRQIRTGVLDSVSPDKDVDGFHPENVGLIAQGPPPLPALTPMESSSC
ncbi:MAG: hypothetical protein CM1200mP2_56840 [Planctomycetaceae bacterium]|nr:MAG: hypothetical protein CM1200mP2_56840 [Planctomycetaceae bacterium]